MSWKEKAINSLKDSLYPVPSELNEIDWKIGNIALNNLAQSVQIQAVKFMISASHGISFESQIAMTGLSVEEVLELLDYRRFYERLGKNIPKSADTILSMLAEYDFVLQGEKSLNITNLIRLIAFLY
jgi:hypothetical protein